MFENHKKESPILGIAGFGGGAAWAVLKAVVSAISDATIEAVGGATTFSHDDGYTYHVFTEDGTFDVQTLSGPASLEFFAVGGGGGGGDDKTAQAGGGGAGGYLTGVSGITTTGSFPITVGVGGTWITSTTEFSVGTATTIIFPGGTQISGFGGHGGVELIQPPEGGIAGAGQSVSLGSGGGGGVDGTTGRPGGSGGPQGNPGGNNSTQSDDGAGGGGGAGSAGQDGDLSGATAGGHGGFGKISNFHVLSSVGYGGAAPGGSTPNAWFAGGGGGSILKNGQNAPGGGSALYVGRSATRAEAEGLDDISNTGVLWNSGPFAGAGAGLESPLQGEDPSKHATANTGSGGGGVTNTLAGTPAGSGDGAPGIAVIRYQNGSPIYGGNNAYYTPEGKKVFVFTEPGTLVNNDPTITSADYFLVGGGGGGSCNDDSGGGGGAGGLLTGIGQTIEVATYNITIGIGGTSVSGLYGEHGTDTVALGLTAFGGGGGNGNQGVGGINPLPFGGSGGGGTSESGQANQGNAAGSPQGNAGGDGNSDNAGGGGGGAGTAGSAAVGAIAGIGGTGVQAPAAFRSPFWTYGDPGNGGWWFAGGGGGGCDGSPVVNTGIGGIGGGGDGGTENSSSSIAKDGLFGTGGGGGGGGNLLPNAPGIPERSGTGGPGIALISVDAPEVKAIGGDYIYSTDTHIVHVFTQPGILTATSSIFDTTSVLVAGGGGGGGGGNNYAGGGGAGGYRSLSTGSLPASSYPVTVGTGGAGDTTASTASPGTDSVFNGFTAAGGGGGGGSSTNAANGGSGGGSKNGAAGSGNTPAVSPPQGNPGTTGGSATGGGGGGATSAATASNNDGGTGGSGGDGAQAPSIFRNGGYIFGTPGPQPGGFYFAGGGGGSGSVTAGLGGYGGGGNGTLGNITTPGTAGQTNTGGGGGGGGDTPGNDGAPGIVMISYSKTDAGFVSLREAGSITQGSSGDNVSLVLNKPSQTQEGDIMIAFGAQQTGDDNWTMASGWTQIVDYTGGTSGVFVAYKVAGSSEPSSYTFTSNVSFDNMSGVIVTYDGAFDVVGTVGEGNTSGVQTAPGINVSEDNSTLLAWFEDSTGNRSWSNQTSGLTEVVADDTSNGGPSWVLYEDAISAGASGDRQATCSNTTDGDVAVLIALKPKP